MMFINEKTILVRGNIYTNMIFDSRLLTMGGITIHAKRDVFLDIRERPSKMRPEDFYLDYQSFIKTYGPIQDIIASSNL